MPFCIICHDSKTQFRVLHAPVFPREAPLNARVVAHCVCTDCATGLSSCPVCRCDVHPSLVVIEEEDHKCGHLFAVRDAHGNLPASSFAFCGSSCGTESYCHHHGGDYADLPEVQSNDESGDHTNLPRAGIPRIPQIHSNDEDEALALRVLAESDVTAAVLSAATRERIMRRRKQKTPAATPTQLVQHVQQSRVAFQEVTDYSKGLDVL